MLSIQNVSMAQRDRRIQKSPRRPPHFVKEWRKFRGLTQEQLAERAGMSPNNISQLENNRQRYSADGLDRLAAALNCDPAHLLLVDPSKEDAIWPIWERANQVERVRIVAVAKALMKNGP